MKKITDIFGLCQFSQLSEQPEMSTLTQTLLARTQPCLYSQFEKRRWCQQPTLRHTGPIAPQQLINGCDITVLNTTKTSKAWWVREDTIRHLFILISSWKRKIQICLIVVIKQNGLLTRPHGYLSLVEVKHTRDSIFKHAKRNVLWNIQRFYWS